MIQDDIEQILQKHPVQSPVVLPVRTVLTVLQVLAHSSEGHLQYLWCLKADLTDAGQLHGRRVAIGPAWRGPGLATMRTSRHERSRACCLEVRACRVRARVSAVRAARGA